MQHPKRGFSPLLTAAAKEEGHFFVVVFFLFNFFPTRSECSHHMNSSHFNMTALKCIYFQNEQVVLAVLTDAPASAAKSTVSKYFRRLTKVPKVSFPHSANPNIKHWEGTTNCLNSLSQFLLNLAKNVFSQEHFTKAETLVTLKINLWTTSQKQIVIPDAREQFVSVSAVLKFNEYVLGILQSHHNKMVRYNQRPSEYFTVINKQTHQVIP